MQKNILIVANLIGFVNFLKCDINTLQNKGYKVYFAANANTIHDSKTIEELKSLHVEFINIDFDSKNPLSIKNLKSYKKITEILSNIKFELIHCHTPIVGLVTRLAARKYRKNGIKVIYTTHGFTFTNLSSKLKWYMFFYIEKFASRYTDLIITINKEDYSNAKMMKCKNVKYINGVGVDTDKYRNVEINREQYRKSIGVNDDDIMILSVGELSRRKNQEIIIHALNKLENKREFIFIVCGMEVGESGTKSRLISLAEEKNVRLSLLGFRNDIPQLMHCSDIGVIPSIREGLGLAGIQSLSAGVPLIGSNVQGIKDYIIDGETGFLCNPFNEDEFAEAIKKLSNKNERNKFVDKCYLISNKFDTKISKKQMEEIYNSILE